MSHDSSKITVVLVGDSDIDQWSPKVYPKASKHFRAGLSGATLQECIPLVANVVPQALSDKDVQYVFVVACAGENDISQSISTEDTCTALARFIDAVWSHAPARTLQ